MAKYVVTVNGQDYEVDGVNSPQEAYAALAGQASQGPLEHDFSAWETAKNVPGSAVQYGKDVVTPLIHPIDTASSLYDLGGSVLAKGQRKVQELASGVDIPEGEDESAANAIGEYLKERYGGIEQIQRTLQEDPVGFMTDLSGVGMMSKIGKVQKIAGAIEPVNLAVKTARSAGKALTPEGTPSKLYQSSAKFSTTLDPTKRDALVRTALEQGIEPTARGAEKLSGRIDVLNTVLDDMIMEATGKGIGIPVREVTRHLDDLRRTKGGIRIEGASDLKAIDRIEDMFYESVGDQLIITPKDLQEFKVDAYNKINWDAKRMTGTPIKEDTFKAMARGGKDALAEQIPEATDINRQLGELYELQPHLTRSANRIDNRNLVSINTPMNVGVGGLVGDVLGSGGAGMSVGAIGTILGNPKVKAKIAIALNKLKQGDIGWLEQNLTSAEIRVALTLAGRGEEIINEIPSESTNQAASQ